MNPPFPSSDSIWRVRLRELQKLYTKQAIVEAYEPKLGLENLYLQTTGKIEEMPEAFSGVWGYEGDSIAVKINGDWWPSSRVREKKT